MSFVHFCPFPQTLTEKIKVQKCGVVDNVLRRKSVSYIELHKVGIDIINLHQAEFGQNTLCVASNTFVPSPIIFSVKGLVLRDSDGVNN